MSTVCAVYVYTPLPGLWQILPRKPGWKDNPPRTCCCTRELTYTATKPELREESRSTVTGIDEGADESRRAVERHVVHYLQSHLTLLITSRRQHLICTSQHHGDSWILRPVTMYTVTDDRYPINGHFTKDNLGRSAQERLNQSGLGNRWRDDRLTVESAGLHANHLHLARQTDNHASTSSQFLTGWMLFLAHN